MEARGVGIVGADTRRVVRLALWIALTEAAPERLPDPDFRVLSGRPLPLLRMAGFEASAVEKVAAALAPL